MVNEKSKYFYQGKAHLLYFLDIYPYNFTWYLTDLP